MLKMLSALKAFFVFIGRYAKWFSVILFGIVVAVVGVWFRRNNKPELSDAENKMLKEMPERLKKDQEAYEKATATAMKPKSADEIKSDFDSNFGGKP